MTTIPLDFNVGLQQYALLSQANVSGGRGSQIISFFDPTGGLPASPSQYDAYIASATANGWIVNNRYYWNGESWTEVVPPIGDLTFVKGGPTFPENVIVWEGPPDNWQPVFQGAGTVFGFPPTAVDAVVRWDDVNGTLIKNSLASCTLG
jgi:hypothetical protein